MRSVAIPILAWLGRCFSRVRGLPRGDPSPRYRVRWDDGRGTIYAPASGTLQAQPLIFDTATAEIIGERQVVVSRSFGRLGLILEDYSYLKRAITNDTQPPPATTH